MNYRYVVNQLALLSIALGGLLLLVSAYSLVSVMLGQAGERWPMISMLTSAGCALVPGGLLYLATRSRGHSFDRREAILLVSLSWVLGAGLCALPFFIWARSSGQSSLPAQIMASPVNAYFEAMSGLTTTGATVLSDIESMPKGLLLWRAFTHWLGGLGIVVLFVAVLPSLGVGARKLFRFEAPGPEKGGMAHQIRDSARILWIIYSVITGALILLLVIAGMGPFDAICHAFSTLGTGGFSNTDASVAGFASSAIDVVLIVFMFMAGTNFTLYYLLARGKWREVLRDTELRVYAALMGIATILIAIMIIPMPHTMVDGTIVNASVASALEHAAFSVASIQTTTGFTTADSDRWPFAAKCLLLFVMFVGGCAGSTSGGLKVIRFWICLKLLLVEIERVFRPHVVRPVRVGIAAIEPEMKVAVLAYTFGFVMLLGMGTFLVLALEPEDETTFATAVSASFATLCTTGPGIEGVGASKNYGHFTDPTKIVLCLWMLLGRLEIFAVICLLNPRFWKGA